MCYNSPWHNYVFYKYVYCIAFLLIVSNCNIIRTKLQFVRYVLQRYFSVQIDFVCTYGIPRHGYK
jgi:hypothetical protein